MVRGVSIRWLLVSWVVELVKNPDAAGSFDKIHSLSNLNLNLLDFAVGFDQLVANLQ